jgi:cobalt/nickel transport system ATP-binding protein
VVADGTPEEILANRDLLLSVNLIHEHTHLHSDLHWGEAHEHEHPIGHHDELEPDLRLA